VRKRRSNIQTTRLSKNSSKIGAPRTDAEIRPDLEKTLTNLGHANAEQRP